MSFLRSELKESWFDLFSARLTFADTKIGPKLYSEIKCSRLWQSSLTIQSLSLLLHVKKTQPTYFTEFKNSLYYSAVNLFAMVTCIRRLLTAQFKLYLMFKIRSNSLVVRKWTPTPGFPDSKPQSFTHPRSIKFVTGISAQYQTLPLSAGGQLSVPNFEKGVV